MKIKSLLMFLVMLAPLTSHASLITFSSGSDVFLPGDTVALEVTVDGANPNIDWLEVVWGYDPTRFSFQSLAITQDVLFSTYYYDAFNIDDELILHLGLLPGWADVLGNTFTLGTFSFTALEASAAPALALTEELALDITGKDIAVTAVTAPATLILLCLPLVLLLFKRKL
ncbi:hypothetical protein [Aestuariibacter sp. A3R04]|uniref:hypothetical protein n=1 Tax=Aestuariibacter sp. A3R04 TaxID=2841571 RepID=UPI001C08917F|nr:hypothetical protein [Aestuariibacter sp. A3R04]MBU3020427.1 hypothetical protein [Aestuariibacter sp. A3R04]